MGTLRNTAPAGEVNEADRLEQGMPPARDARELHSMPPDASDADVLEQEAPLVDDSEVVGIDAERTEPVSDEDWTSTSSGG